MGRHRDVVILGRVLQQARPYWRHLATLLMLSLLWGPLLLLEPLPLKIIADSVIGDHPVPAVLGRFAGAHLLIFCIVLTIGVAVLEKLRDLAAWVLATFIGERLVLDFRARLFQHAQRLSLSYHDRVGTADSLYRIQQDAHAVQQVLIWGLNPFVTAAVTLAAMFYVIFRISPSLATVAMVVTPALLLLISACKGRLRTGWDRVKAFESQAMSVVQEVLGSIRVVKAFGQEERERQRFVHHGGQGARGQIRMAATGGVFNLLIGLTTALGSAIVLYLGVRQVQSRAITFGDLLMVVAYLVHMYRPLETISQKVGEMQSALASAERAFRVLDEVPEVVERPHAKLLRRAQGALTFEDVWFAFDREQFVLQGIDLHIPAGAFVGIAGTTGAGKTTLISLLFRFYDPSRGRILLDGVDLRDLRLADLRAQFAMILQEPTLFSASLAENIAYGRTGATDTEIVEAARAANAHEFITRLPEGYGTRVGERGMLLSGGERQRISLARAFLKDAPMLVLDEPTSSVDVRTEASILEAMERLTRGRTTLMIAHRLDTLARCDVRLELEEGRLCGSGSPIAAGLGRAQ